MTERNRLVNAPRPLTPLVLKSTVMGTGAQATDDTDFENTKRPTNREIGRASCRERVSTSV